MKTSVKHNPFENAKRFDEHLKRERKLFPRERIERLVATRPGLWRWLSALHVIPWLIRTANRCLESRWQSARTPPSSGMIVLVHALAPGGGFIQGFYSDGRWWTTVFVDDGTEWGAHKKREIRVCQWREIEGSAAEPWHDDDRYYPPSFEDRPARVYAEPPKRRMEFSSHAAKMYDRALQKDLFIRWNPECKPHGDTVLNLMAQYFIGIDTMVHIVDYAGGRRGFDVDLISLPKQRPYSCGEDPDQAPERYQKILVQLNEESFHASGMGNATTEALAIGLNVFMQDQLEKLETEGARERQLLGRNAAGDPKP